jgi:sodium/bile acid cotransporter 7
MERIREILKKAGLDGFIPLLGIAIVVAYFFPQAGIMEKPFSLEKATNIGVSIVFFLYGLRLSLAKLKTGIVNWRMHLVIQGTVFLLFPLLMLAIKPLFGDGPGQTMWIALFFLSVLPSTVSSSVMMVSIGGGNIPGAIFNASISALVGVFFTPLWIGAFVPSAGGGVDFGETVLKLVLQVLVPVLAGMLLNRYWGGWAERNKKKLRLFDQTVILSIVYTSFSHSFSSGLFGNLSWAGIVLLAGGMLLLFFVVFFSVWWLSGVLGFSRADRITSVFCGSKKSLVHGTVMSKILFAGNPSIGLILLPLMLYHSLQLLSSSALAQRFSRHHE